ncbi:MAG: 6-bladed beta-propeller [Candidatus Aminicenantes bacterium]|nr:6-bladed beta-propeller [Candidatus Aminicenantes bacterium]
MKTRAISLLVILLILCSIIISKEQRQKIEWKGKIEIEDGSKVIKNPGEPLYGEITFELEEDLSIGNEDDENYIFYGLVTLAVDSEENIFVLDGGNCRIQKFDKNGSYLQTIGGRGQGPGEFEQPMWIHVDVKDIIYVFDSLGRYLNVFEKDGKFKEKKRLKHSFFGFGISEEGNILTQISFYSPEGSTRDVVIMDSKGKVIKRIVSYPYKLPPRIKKRILGNPYSHRLYFYPALDGSGVYGHSSEYKLYVLNTSGETRFRIEKEEKAEPVTQKDKKRRIDNYLERQEKSSRKEKLSRNEVKKAYVFPKIKPFFSRIILDNERRIYVRRFKLYNPEDRSELYDLFSEKGIYIYRVKMPLPPRIIRKGYIYRIVPDRDTGYIKVKRYKIRNWDKIKEEI